MKINITGTQSGKTYINTTLDAKRRLIDRFYNKFSELNTGLKLAINCFLGQEWVSTYDMKPIWLNQDHEWIYYNGSGDYAATPMMKIDDFIVELNKLNLDGSEYVYMINCLNKVPHKFELPIKEMTVDGVW